jgi:NADH-quinone oxidoreductase subunit F
VERFKEEIKDRHLEEKIEVRASGCHGFCERGPLVVIRPEMICYMNVESTDVSQILSDTVLGGKVIDRLLYQDPLTKEKIVREQDIPFYKFQRRIVFGRNGEIDPTQIDDSIAIGGYQGLEKVLSEMKPEEVIETMKKIRPERPRGWRIFHRRKMGGLSKRKREGKVRHLQCR